MPKEMDLGFLSCRRILHQSINQGDSSITAYFTQLKLYWDQLKNFKLALTCSCGKCTCNLSQRIENVHF